MNYEKVNETAKELHEICFNQKNGVIHHALYNEDFSFKNNYDGSSKCFREPDAITGFCDLCRDCAEPVDKTADNKFKLSAISHGSHSFDFLEALGITDIRNHTQNWNDQPVLFLMENPSLDYEIYDYLPTDTLHEGKRPARQWYWIHSDLEPYKEYESNKYLRMSEYGSMVASLIVQFKLSNAYLTNIVKCGMSDAEYKEGARNNLHESTFKSTWSYQPKCIRTCMEKVLKKEVQALLQKEEKITVFAFGGRVYQLAGEFFRNCEFREQVRLFKLPHPAGRMSNDYRRYVLKGIVAEALQVFLDLGKAEPAALKKPMNKAACKAVFEKQFKDVRFEGKTVNFSDYKTTKNQLGLIINPSKSIFNDEETVSDIKLGDNLDQTGKKEIGYVFSSDSYWAWDSGKNKPMECSDFRYFKEFQNCINEILSKNQ